jgi:hypothetical protein
VPFRHSPQPVAPSHWSKDFVEHLRTVHLALIATAAALIVVALTTKPYSTEVAKNELHKILDLQKNWNQYLFPFTEAPRASFNFVKSTPLASGLISQNDIDNDIGMDPLWFTRKTLKGTYKDDESKTQPDFRLILPEYQTVMTNFNKSDTIDHFNDIEYAGKIPDRLDLVQYWWDSLDSKGVEIRNPISLAQCGLLYDRDKKKFYKLSLYFERVSLQTGTPDELSEPTPQKSDVTLTLEPDEPIAFVGRLARIYGTKSVSLPVVRYSYNKVNTEKIAAYKGLLHSDFAHSFYDLRQVANKHGVEDLLELQSVLSTSEVSETAVFEAFGIKFPADVATLGGTIALLCVQLYFFLYLRKLSGSLKPDDPGWDVPWIGMDSTGLAGGIFLLTVALLPVASMTLLGAVSAARFTRGYRQLNSIHVLPHCEVWHWYWSVQAKIYCLTAAVIVSLVLGLLCWKYRPQLSRGSEPIESPADLTDIDANEI